MAWTKQVFTDFVTVIDAEFLNGIQDQLISDESSFVTEERVNTLIENYINLRSADDIEY